MQLSSLKNDVYYGDFENDQRHGQGILLYANGDIYRGEFYRGKKDGEGSMFYLIQNTDHYDEYVGSWVND